MLELLRMKNDLLETQNKVLKLMIAAAHIPSAKGLEDDLRALFDALSDKIEKYDNEVDEIEEITQRELTQEEKRAIMIEESFLSMPWALDNDPSYKFNDELMVVPV